MSELTFSQPERRNFLVPILVALVIVGGVFCVDLPTSAHIADLAITHVAVVPEHTVFESLSKVVRPRENGKRRTICSVLTTVEQRQHSVEDTAVDRRHERHAQRAG